MLTRSLCARSLRGVMAAALLTGALAASVSAAPAEAAVGDLTCTAVYQIDFRPALTPFNTKSQATIVLGLSNCLSLNGRYTSLRAATSTGAGTATSVGLVPCSLVITIPFQFQINWSNGDQSTMSALVNDNPFTGQLGFNGSVTSGPLAGDKVFAIGPFLPNADCLLHGLTSLVGTNQKVFG